MDLCTEGGVVGEGDCEDSGEIKAGGILNVNLIPPSSSSPMNSSSVPVFTVSSCSSSSRTTPSPEPVESIESFDGSDPTSIPTSMGSTKGGNSSPSSSTGPKKPLENGFEFVVSGRTAEFGGESPMSSRQPKNRSISSGICCWEAA